MTNIAKLRQEHEKLLLSIAQVGFESGLVNAAFDNLESAGPLCFNNFGYALRELLRHVFHRLAPDGEVTRCVWYKPDPTSKNGITRANRSKYMLQGGLTDLFVKRKLGIDIAVVSSDLTSAFDLLNRFTHIGPATFDLSIAEVETLAEQCLSAARDLIEQIAECRRLVLEQLAREIDQHLLNEAISETVNELDEIATHYCIDHVVVEVAEVVDIGPSELTVNVAGDVEVALQYGSSSDLKNDIGTSMSDSFPFTGTVSIPFKRPLGKSAKVSNFKVDTSSWYDDGVCEPE